MKRNETIAAIATAPGRSGVAVIRVSGPDAFAVGARVAGRVLTPGLHVVRTPYDECLVLVFPNPKSYTGEDVVEFQCHGGEVTPRRILEACFAAGARLARRGEFTERAFLNGKLDSLQAESVLDLINAKTVRAADAALEGLSGRVQKASRDLYECALALSTQLEHALDVSEEELSESFYATIRAQFSTLITQLSTTLAQAHDGQLLRKGALVVLAGPPNAGKSSLLNALLGENRAIVSDIPGTTRDSIEEGMDLEGYPIRLVDTAGLRKTTDVIEAEGVRRSESLIAKADVVVNFDAEGEALAASDNRRIRIHAKCDLGRGEGLNLSAKTGEGLEELKHRILEVLRLNSVREEGQNTPSERAMAVLLEVQTSLATVDLSDSSCDLVLAANALRHAAEALGTLVGATYATDLMDNLFARFCVGK